jgi:hypothetical protein
LSAIWPAILFSLLSAGAFGTAIAFGFRLANVRDRQLRHSTESRAALAAAAGAVLLLVAAVLWLSYLIFGPIHDAVTEILNGD